VSGLGQGNRSLAGYFLGAELANGTRAYDMFQRQLDIAAGDLRVEIDRSFPLSEAAAANAYIESRQVVGRVILVP
jgi:NADPH2:quinone reductase